MLTKIGKNAVSGSLVTANEVALTSAATPGRLLVSGVAGDKDFGSDPSPSTGWTLVAAHHSASVSIGLAIRVADGSADDDCEWSWSSAKISYTWIGEEDSFADLESLDDVELDFAAAFTNESSVTSLPVGPAVAVGDGVAICHQAVDTGGNWSPGHAWTGDFVAVGALDDVGGPSGDPGVFVAARTVEDEESVSTTVSTSGGGDQTSAILLVVGGTLAPPPEPEEPGVWHTISEQITYVPDEPPAGRLKVDTRNGDASHEMERRGVRMGDGAVRLPVHLGAVKSGHSCGCYFKLQPGGRTLLGRWNAASDEIHLRDGTVGGSFDTLASEACAISADSDYEVVCAIAGDDVTVSVFVDGSPTPQAVLEHTLTAGDASEFGAGVAGSVGVRHASDGTDETIGPMEILPAAPYVWAVGDAGVDNAGAQSVAARIVDATHLLYLGDVYPDGDAEAFADGFDPVWGAGGDIDWRPVTYPTSGNYEWPHHDDPGCYDDYWQPWQALKGLPDTPPGNSRYSLEINGWTVIVLNTEENGGVGEGIGSTAETWLDEQLDLAAGKAIVIGHRPRYSPGDPGEDRGDQPDLADMWDLLAGRAVAYLSGHSHLSAVMPEVDGVTQIIAGAGGDGFTDATDDSAIGNADFANDEDEALLRLAFGADTIDCEFVDAATGDTLHTFTLGTPDTDPPDTSIDTGPDDPTDETTATFTFSADEDGCTFEGQLNDGGWETVTSPHEITGLDPGEHVFEVRATDAAENTDPTPAEWAWTIEGDEPPPAPIVPAARVVSEPVDDRLYVELEHAGGRRSRWAEDDPDASGIPQDLEINDTALGGFTDASLSLARDARRDWPDLALVDKVTISGRTAPLGRSAWEGQQEHFPSVLGDDVSIGVNAIGRQVKLAAKPYRDLIVDQDMSRWTDPPLARRKGHADAGNAMGKISRSAANGGIAWDVPNEALSTNTVDEMVYELPAGVRAQALLYRGTRKGTWTNFEAATVWSGDDGESFPSSTGLTLDDTIRQANLATARRWLLLRALVTTGHTPAAGVQQSYDRLGVVGDHDIPLQPIDGGLPGVYGHDALAHIVAGAGLNFTTGPTGTIRDNPSFVVNQAAWLDSGAKRRQAVEEINEWFQWWWAVWENDTFWWQPWDSSAPWVARIQGGAHWSPAGVQATSLFNGVVVSYTTPDGIDKTVGPPGSRCDTESPLLADTRPSNALNAHGEERWEELTVGHPLDDLAARQLGFVWMDDHKLPQRSGDLVVRPLGDGHVPQLEHPTIGPVPVWACRSGDMIDLVDFPDPQPWKVVDKSYSHATKTLRLKLDTVTNSLTGLFARLDVRSRGAR